MKDLVDLVKRLPPRRRIETTSKGKTLSNGGVALEYPVVWRQHVKEDKARGFVPELDWPQFDDRPFNFDR